MRALEEDSKEATDVLEQKAREYEIAPGDIAAERERAVEDLYREIYGD